MTYAHITIWLILFAVAGQAQQRDTLTILHVSDTHGNLSSGGPRTAEAQGTVGGLARAATVIGMTRMQDPSTLVVHAGDFFIGDLTFNATLGVAEMQALEQLGFDAITLGNHEFDLTPSGFFLAYGQANLSVPLLSSNLELRDPALLPLQPFINSFLVKEVNGMRVGMFGMTTPEANLLSMVQPEAFVDTALVDTALVEIALAMIDSLRTGHGCHVVVMVSHLGLQLDRMLAAALPGIDAVISAHDHVITPPEEVLVPTLHGGRVPVVQAGSHYHAIGRLRLTVTGGAASFLDWTAIALDGSVPEEPQVKGLVDNLQAMIETQFGQPVFSQPIALVNARCDETADSLTVVGNHATPVGNIVTDAFRAALGTDIAITAGGSTAQPLYPGPIVANDVMRMIGYGFNTVNGLGFRMVRFELPGAALYAGLQYGLSRAVSSGNDEFLVQVSGMRYDYIMKVDHSGAEPDMTAEIAGITVDGQPLDPSATYSVAANEFVFGILSMILAELQISPGNVVLSDSLTEFEVVTGFLVAAGTVRPYGEDRIRCLSIVSAESPAATPRRHAISHYPQPVRDQATLVFDLPAAAAVAIDLYDHLGRKVLTLADGTRSAGVHRVPFTAAGLPSGTYHAVLSVDGARSARRLTIVR